VGRLLYRCAGRLRLGDGGQIDDLRFCADWNRTCSGSDGAAVPPDDRKCLH
jgi:hypothetical protein